MIIFVGFFGFIKHVVVLSIFSLSLLLLIKMIENYNKSETTWSRRRR
jgi:hypothetical protein